MIRAFVPLRSGSKGLPGKNLNCFCGRPLAFWLIDQLLECNKIDQVVVAVNSDTFESTLKFQYSNKISIHRSSEKSARDEAMWEETLLEYLSADYFEDDDTIIMAQVTSPFTNVKDIKGALAKFLSFSKTYSIVTGVRVHRFFWSAQKDGSCAVSVNYDYGNRPRRQDFDGPIVENGALCINTVKRLREQKSRLTFPVAIYEMLEHTLIEIDTQDDWKLAEWLFVKYEQPHRKAPCRC